MKYYIPAALLVALLLAAGACSGDSTPAPDLEATIEAAVEATLVAQPTDTPAPDMQATIAAAVEATLVAQPTSVPPTDALVASDQERPFRSYPAPTGYPGFRKYYQKRCYPGCHYDASDGTPTPSAVHP